MKNTCRNIPVLVKPASAACNLRCQYCFYLETAGCRLEGDRGIMEKDTAAALIATTLDFAAGGTVTYLFQGGEPLVAGLDFFRQFVELVEEHRQGQAERLAHETAGKENQVSHACYMLQTNGTLLTPEFCQFFAHHSFSLGISLDGPAHIHDQHRTYQDGTGSHRQVMAAIEMLRHYKVTFSILSVITEAWVGHEEEIYRWFQENKLHHLQFIHCILPAVPPQVEPEPPQDKLVRQDGLVLDTFSLTHQQFSQLNKVLFGLYWKDMTAGTDISIRFYDNLLAMVQGYQPEQCGMLGYCPATITLESDGSLYPCDFYCSDNWYIGNIKEMNLKELFYHPVMQRFITSSQQREEECTHCPVLALCRGGCRRERDRDGTGSLGLHHYCQGRKDFFNYFLATIQSAPPGT